jgi:hypothetical protein
MGRHFMNELCLLPTHFACTPQLQLPTVYGANDEINNLYYYQPQQLQLRPQQLPRRRVRAQVRFFSRILMYAYTNSRAYT